MAYILTYGSALDHQTLIEGMTVCFNTIANNPNAVGILERGSEIERKWKATIDGITYLFDANGVSIVPVSGKQLYEPKFNNIESGGGDSIALSRRAGITRSATDSQTEQNVVSITSLSAKDTFAVHAMQALIGGFKNPLSINDGTIAIICAKSYKIAEGMMLQATEARKNDGKVTTEDDQSTLPSAGEAVAVNNTELTTVSDKLLYNLVEAIKAGSDISKDQYNKGIPVKNFTGTELSTKPTIQGTPTVQIQGTPTVNLASGASVSVSNMPSEPIHVREQGTVSVSGTVSVDNFPSDSNNSE